MQGSSKIAVRHLEGVLSQCPLYDVQVVACVASSILFHHLEDGPHFMAGRSVQRFEEFDVSAEYICPDAGHVSCQIVNYILVGCSVYFVCNPNKCSLVISNPSSRRREGLV